MAINPRPSTNPTLFADIPVIKVVTHDGIFHGDEIIAVAVLVLGYTMDRLEVIRTRNPATVAGAHIVLDVGGRYVAPDDTGRWFLDHHQWPRGQGEKRTHGWPFATAGLCWRHFGRLAIEAEAPLLTTEEVGSVHLLVDRDFVSPIDAADCGIDFVAPECPGMRPLTVSGLIASYNPVWGQSRSAKEVDELFMNVVGSVGAPALRHAIRGAAARVRARSAVQAAIRAPRLSPAIVTLSVGCPWQEALLELEEAKDVLYVLYPDTGGQWRVQCVPQTVTSRASRKPLPEEWAGLNEQGGDGRQTLAEASGVVDAIFCHPGRFMAGARTMNGALRLAELACAAP